ncbi:hypothetical protein [Klebsiella michiganensis]|uniref:hypothetical protein n=1 Tax=Klebsiella michiganensis TaxID=1134687 RepID=UPI002E151AE9|nr:hypothetical protein [Klebsiella michiganensis]MCD6621029.1 hypothetical protein [Klebsiella michiganensis]
MALWRHCSALQLQTCHTLACELDIGDERTEMFEIYGVLHNLGRRGYACQVGQRMNPLLASCDDDDDDNWDEDDD